MSCVGKGEGEAGGRRVRLQVLLQSEDLVTDQTSLAVLGVVLWTWGTAPF